MRDTVKHCLHCNAPMRGCRTDRNYCSESCRQRAAFGRPKFPYARVCRTCFAEFSVATKADANRQYCCQACAKKGSQKSIKGWNEANPGEMKRYNQNRLAADPSVWQEKSRRERREILAMLGGKCIVCEASNPNWLHVDYIPTTRGKPHRHPRHLKYIKENIANFRLLCANHHYELTLTGAIEGTEILQ